MDYHVSDRHGSYTRGRVVTIARIIHTRSCCYYCTDHTHAVVLLLLHGSYTRGRVVTIARIIHTRSCCYYCTDHTHAVVLLLLHGSYTRGRVVTIALWFRTITTSRRLHVLWVCLTSWVMPRLANVTEKSWASGSETMSRWEFKSTEITMSWGPTSHCPSKLITSNEIKTFILDGGGGILLPIWKFSTFKP